MGKRGSWSSTRTKVNRNDGFIAAVLTKTENRTKTELLQKTSACHRVIDLLVLG